MAHRVFVSRRIYLSIPPKKLTIYLPKSTSFAPAGTDLDLGVKLLKNI